MEGIFKPAAFGFFWNTDWTDGARIIQPAAFGFFWNTDLKN
jgi:hypothetical protein